MRSPGAGARLRRVIRALPPARNALLDLEERTGEELDQVKEQYRKLAEDSRSGHDEHSGGAGRAPERKNGRKSA